MDLSFEEGGYNLYRKTCEEELVGNCQAGRGVKRKKKRQEIRVHLGRGQTGKLVQGVGA